MSVAVAESAAGLPRYLSRFVGRTAELAALRRQVLRSPGRDRSQRLIVLLGPGGIGKSRLAVELACRLAAEPASPTGLHHGVCWVDCVPICGTDGLIGAVARAAGLPGLGGAEPEIALAHLLHLRRDVLVLDNGEHLTEAIQDFASVILPECPGLTVVVTSRSPIPTGTETTIGPLGSESAGGNEAVELFFDRASLVAPGFRSGIHVAEHVAAICRHLDGSPLAIELAAPWVRTLSPADLRRILQQSTDLLSSSDPDLSPRHRAMRAVLDGTWAAMSAREQAVLGRLGIFVGGFGLSAAEEVAGADVSILANLTAIGVIRRVPQPHDDTWFVMHELLRQFAADKLRERPDDELVLLRERHLRQLITCAENFERARAGPGEDLWIDRLVREQSNVDAELDWSLSHGCGALLLSLLASLGNIWVYAGAGLQRHRDLIYAALELPWERSSTTALVARRRVAYMAGWGRFGDGEVEKARGQFRESLSLSRTPAETRDPDLETTCLRALSRLAIEDGDPGAAQRYAQESLEISQRDGLELAVAWTYAHLAEAAFAADDLVLTEAHLVRSAEIFRRLDDRFGEAMISTDLGDLRRRAGRTLDALDAYGHATSAWRRSSATAVGRNLLRGVGAAAVTAGLHEQAAELFGASDTWALIFGAWEDVISLAPEAERAIGSSRLGASAWSAAHRRGLRLEPDHVLIMAEETIARCRSTLNPPANLTVREREVLELVAGGLSNREIAVRLRRSDRTVHAHLRSIYVKLEVTSRTAALHEARRFGVLPAH